MKPPKYTLNKAILLNLKEIERIYGRLEGMAIPAQLLLNLERVNLVNSSYSSNRIEGNPLSIAEVTNLLLSERVPINRSEKEVQNYFDILTSFNSELKDRLKISDILLIHKQLMNGVNDGIKGKFRDEDVVIGRIDSTGKVIPKHIPPFHKKAHIEKEIKALIDWANSSKDLAILNAAVFHHYFVYIHPFLDGNGRVCRLLTAKYLLSHGYLINKYFVLDDYYDIDKENYSDALHMADKGDLTKWIEYFTSGMKYSLQSAIVKVQHGFMKIAHERGLSINESKALEFINIEGNISSVELATKLGLSRQQAFNILNELLKRGFVEQQGGRRNSRYYAANL